ncbi:unnamed protein product, partial [Ectocarpus sp. 8 AP-2014]
MVVVLRHVLPLLEAVFCFPLCRRRWLPLTSRETIAGPLAGPALLVPRLRIVTLFVKARFTLVACYGLWQEGERESERHRIAGRLLDRPALLILRMTLTLLVKARKPRFCWRLLRLL